MGYVSTSRDSRLWEAVLYAGPGAMLSHLTAAQHRNYIKYAPTTIDITTPRKIKSLPGVNVYARRNIPRTLVNGIPATNLEDTILDLARTRPDLLKRALSQLDYTHEYDLETLRAIPNRTLQQALDTYDPNYARLNEQFELDFYEFCVNHRIEPLPTPNVEIVPGITVDALWPEHNLAVELDGKGNHHSDAQLLRDAQRDMTLRDHNISVIRYRRAQLKREPQKVRKDLESTLRLSAKSTQRSFSTNT
ncbi:MAG: DUF559 domain-containing protein [Solirubrobacterales bacterium]|nr:DUF559 domain-containing protein [Solirubrobacterales bacterium]